MESFVEPAVTRFHCVSCGKIWGDGIDIGSSGFCIECLAVWAKIKKPCFGSRYPKSIDCKFYNFCKEYYGIR
jgi:hypothetical protein